MLYIHVYDHLIVQDKCYYVLASLFHEATEGRYGKLSAIITSHHSLVSVLNIQFGNYLIGGQVYIDQQDTFQDIFLQFVHQYWLRVLYK